jgi:hypothetical protein
VVTHGTGCTGWVHSLTGGHVCYVPYLAEPDEVATRVKVGGAAELPARPGWNVPSRPRDLTGTEGIPRTLWEAAQ